MHQRPIGLFSTRAVVPLLLGGVLAVASATGFACSGDSGPKTFTVDEASFEFPGGWSKGKVEDEEFADNQKFSGLVGATDDNYIYIAKYELNIDVDQDVIDEQGDALDQEIRGILESDGSTIEDGPDQDTVAGFPALVYEGTTDDDGEFNHRWVFVFNGKDEYFFNCQWDEKHDDEVQDACDEALKTFKVDE